MQKSSVHFGKTRDRQGSFTERFSLREIKKENREEIMKPKNMLLTLDTCLEQEKTGRKTGLLVTALMNGLMLVLSLPFMDWIQLVNIPKLFAKLGITREAAGSLYSSYSIFFPAGICKKFRKRCFRIVCNAAVDPAGCNLVSGASVYLEGLSQQQRGRREGRGFILM